MHQHDTFGQTTGPDGRPLVNRYNSTIKQGNWYEEQKHSQDVKEGVLIGTIQAAKYKNRSSPFTGKQDLTLHELTTTTGSTYQGKQIPQDYIGKREIVLEKSYVATARTLEREWKPEEGSMLPSSDTYGEFYPNRTRGSILGEKNPLANL
ncbi:MAG: hypothetical protein EZS28_017901, partial [Streblomastix strix]